MSVHAYFGFWYFCSWSFTLFSPKRLRCVLRFQDFLSCSVFDLSGPPYKSSTLASYLPYGRVIFSSNPARKWKRCQTIPEFQTISSRQFSKKDCSSRHSFDFILGRQSWILFYDFMILRNVFSYFVKRHFQVSLYFFLFFLPQIGWWKTMLLNT